MFIKMATKINILINTIMTVVMGIAFTAAIVVVLLTLVDIILHNVDRLLGLITGSKSGWAIVGLVDISQLLTMVAAALAIAVAFYRGSHVSVDLLTARFSGRSLWLSKLIATLLNLGFSGGCFWAEYQAMQMDLEASTASATIAIPYLAFWLPLLGGFVLSALGIIARLSVGICTQAGLEPEHSEVLDYV